ncbi:MAG: penicillin acylase family protein, partial [Polyangiaceae bacterium]
VANDPSSTVLPDGTPIFLSANYDTGLRAGRIHQRIDGLAKTKLATLDDIADIQADVRSPLGARLVPGLLTTLQHVAEEQATPGTHPDLTPLVASGRFAPQVLADVTASLKQWGPSFDYAASSGVNPDDDTPLPGDAAAKATLIFNAWRTRMVGAVYADELAQIQAPPAIDLTVSLTYLLTADPKTLATYDATLGDSILFDDLSTPNVVETRDQRQLVAMLDAIDFLNTRVGSDRSTWRWGTLHTVRFDSIVPLWPTMSIPAVGDPTFPIGFPRHGDGYNIDVGTYPVPVTTGSLPATTSFSYDHGPAQRFVIDMDPSGPRARNVLPGGEVWDDTSPHFRDEAELWRRNQDHPVPFSKADVARATESHVVYR